MQITCTDSKGLTDVKTTTITVTANSPPVYTQVPDQVFNVGQTIAISGITYWTDTETPTTLTCTAT